MGLSGAARAQVYQPEPSETSRIRMRGDDGFALQTLDRLMRDIFNNVFEANFRDIVRRRGPPLLARGLTRLS